MRGCVVSDDDLEQAGQEVRAAAADLQADVIMAWSLHGFPSAPSGRRSGVHDSLQPAGEGVSPLQRQSPVALGDTPGLNDPAALNGCRGQ